MNFNLKAREEISLELKGYIPPLCAKELLPEGLQPLVINEMTPICLQLARIERMNWQHLPFVNMHYDKAIWHIAVTKEKERGWFLTICDMNHGFLRHMSHILLNYPVRDAEFSFLEKRKSLVTRHQPETGGEMRCHIELGADDAHKDLVSPFFIKNKNGFRQIDIQETYPDFCRLSKADIIKDEISREIFGNPVQWEKECYVFRGRIVNWQEIPVQ